MGWGLIPQMRLWLKNQLSSESCHVAYQIKENKEQKFCKLKYASGQGSEASFLEKGHVAYPNEGNSEYVNKQAQNRPLHMSLTP